MFEGSSTAWEDRELPNNPSPEGEGAKIKRFPLLLFLFSAEEIFKQEKSAHQKIYETFCEAYFTRSGNRIAN